MADWRWLCSYQANRISGCALMPDLSREEKIAGLKEVIKGYEKLAAEGRRPGIGAYAEKRIPELEAALIIHQAKQAHEA